MKRKDLSTVGSDEWPFGSAQGKRVASSEIGRTPSHPAVFRESAEPFDSKRVVKRFWYKERRERVRSG